MKIKTLELTNFRNCTQQRFEFNPKFNVFFGDNGSGKTSILEAIHLLGLGKSFRTSNIERLVQHQYRTFSLFSTVAREQSTHRVGIGRHLGGQTDIHLNGDKNCSLRQLAELVPLQFINHTSHYLLDSGPKYRRSFLDWGVFHVKHLFYEAWQRSNRLLKQRNAALKTDQPEAVIRIWDEEWIQCQLIISELREQYLKEFVPICLRVLEQLLLIEGLSFTYKHGWPAEQDLASVLDDRFERDRQKGHTYYGSHKADLSITCQNVPVDDVLSRGQQKLLVCAMRLAQGLHLAEYAQKKCIYLIDDLPAELDDEKRHKVGHVLAQLDAQVFVTGIEEADVRGVCDHIQPRVFHVKHLADEGMCVSCEMTGEERCK